MGNNDHLVASASPASLRQDPVDGGLSRSQDPGGASRRFLPIIRAPPACICTHMCMPVGSGRCCSCLPPFTGQQQQLRLACEVCELQGEPRWRNNAGSTRPDRPDRWRRRSAQAVRLQREETSIRDHAGVVYIPPASGRCAAPVAEPQVVCAQLEFYCFCVPDPRRHGLASCSLHIKSRRR